MKIPLPERGNYYRGLLVLIRKDRSISVRERELVIRFGEVLDFDKRFCESAVNDLLDNKHIRNEPVTFSNMAIAECFVRDALLLASIDGEFHPKEMDWLKAVAQANGLEHEWLSNEIRRLQGSQRPPDFPEVSTLDGFSFDAAERRMCCIST
jgi:hypothetical protein